MRARIRAAYERPWPIHPEQWAEYKKRRRCYGMSFLGFLTLIVSGILFSFLPLDRTSGLRVIPLILLIGSALACWVVGFFSFISLLAWRCPNCGSSFVYSFFNSFP